jgi:hypothetical protein
LTNSPEQETQEVGFDLDYSGKSWHVRADSLDAALSLWVYTVREREKQPSVDIKKQSDRTQEQPSGIKDDEWLRRKVPQPCLRLFDPGEMLKAQLLQDLKWWAPQSIEHLSEVEETASSTNGQTEPTDSKSFHAARVISCSPSSTSNTKAQKRNFRTFPPTMKSNKSTLAIELRDSLERLYAKDLLFSFMCSAAKTRGAAIEGEAELRIVDTKNRAPKILRHKTLDKLADSFRSSIFETDNEALMSIIAPLSMGGILPYPHALLESMRNEVVQDWLLGIQTMPRSSSRTL